MLKGAIFDMDGLMFDTERIYRESWKILAGEFGQTHNPEFPAAVAGTSGETMRKVVHKYYPDLDPEIFINACYKKVSDVTSAEIPIKPGLGKILKLFKKSGIRMAVASSSQLPVIERNLKTSGVAQYFDVVVSGINPDIRAGKPAPDIFLYAAMQLGIDPQDCYVFEDSLNGIRAGHAAGATAVMIPDTMEPTEEIRRICRIYSDLVAAADAIEAGEF